jgi:lysophospholipase L1-like esterase
VRNPLLGYCLLPDQKNQFVTINAQGFRDTEPVPLQKPPGEVRIFVLGGSTAFGQLSSSNQTAFASKLETLLSDRVAAQKATPNRFQPEVLPYTADEVNKVLSRPARLPDRTYRVINAAVPGYTSSNELAQLVLQVAAYSPDVVIVLNGYADLMLPSAQMGADIPGLEDALTGKSQGWGSQMAASVDDGFNQLYLVRLIQRYLLPSPQLQAQELSTLNIVSDDGNRPLAEQLPADKAELDRRVARYRDNLLQMVRWSSSAKKRLIIALQPEISSRKPNMMSSEEKAIVSKLGQTYLQGIQAGQVKFGAAASQVAQSSGSIAFLDFYSLYESFAGQAFQSPTSLTDEANTVMAEKLFEAIVGQLAVQPKPFGSEN